MAQLVLGEKPTKRILKKHLKTKKLFDLMKKRFLFKIKNSKKRPESEIKYEVD